MAVTLESLIRRYIGTSRDTKPGPANSVDRDTSIPAGSTFFETDTFKISRFDGLTWTYERGDTRLIDKLDLVLDALGELQTVMEEVRDKL